MYFFTKDRQCFLSVVFHSVQTLLFKGYGQMQNPHVQYRNVVIERMQNTYGVVSLVAENLATYMENVRELVKGISCFSYLCMIY